MMGIVRQVRNHKGKAGKIDGALTGFVDVRAFLRKTRSTQAKASHDINETWVPTRWTRETTQEEIPVAKGVKFSTQLYLEGHLFG